VRTRRSFTIAALNGRTRRGSFPSALVADAAGRAPIANIRGLQCAGDTARVVVVLRPRCRRVDDLSASVGKLRAPTASTRESSTVRQRPRSPRRASSPARSVRGRAAGCGAFSRGGRPVMFACVSNRHAKAVLYDAGSPETAHDAIQQSCRRSHTAPRRYCSSSRAGEAKHSKARLPDRAAPLSRAPVAL